MDRCVAGTMRKLGEESDKPLAVTCDFNQAGWVRSGYLAGEKLCFVFNNTMLTVPGDSNYAVWSIYQSKQTV